MIELEKGQLSEYVELNLNMYFPDITTQVYFNSDVFDVETGQQLVDHTRGYNQGRVFHDSGSGTTPIFNAEAGWQSINKLVTLRANASPSLTRFLPIAALTVPWETATE